LKNKKKISTKLMTSLKINKRYKKMKYSLI